MIRMSPLAIINSQMEDTNISFHFISLTRCRKKNPNNPALGRCFKSLLGEDMGVNV